MRARSGHVTKLAFNHQGLFVALAMRQALAQALDRPAILDITAPDGAGALAETGYFQQGSPWREDRSDPAMAAAHGGRIALEFMPDGARIGIPTAIDKSALLPE